MKVRERLDYLRELFRVSGNHNISIFISLARISFFATISAAEVLTQPVTTEALL